VIAPADLMPPDRATVERVRTELSIDLLLELTYDEVVLALIERVYDGDLSGPALWGAIRRLHAMLRALLTVATPRERLSGLTSALLVERPPLAGRQVLGYARRLAVVLEDLAGASCDSSVRAASPRSGRHRRVP
jgi:hypothetical protein